MKRKFNFKMIILTSIFAVSILFLGTTNSKAVLQANPTTHASPVSKTGAVWITEIRQMETVGQTMGLTETLNGLEATSESNNIDVHMILPTEYRAIAILSASGYGNPGKLRDETDAQKRTTTGNNTGVYFTGDRWEVVSCTGNAPKNYCLNRGTYMKTFSGPFWHGATAIQYPFSRDSWGTYDGLVAGGNGIHSYGNAYVRKDNGFWINQSCVTRGVAV